MPQRGERETWNATVKNHTKQLIFITRNNVEIKEGSMTSDLCATINHRWTDYLESWTDEVKLILIKNLQLDFMC